MSNHLGDTNKMVSDTPRMDQSSYDDGVIWQTGCELERELNAASQRIKRLEEAGDELLMWLGEDIYESNRRLLEHAWRKSKEAKP